MKQIIGYFLGFAIFIVGIPALMWWVAGMPDFADIPVMRLYLAAVAALVGLGISVWSIVYMKRVGKGNPFDAMGHEVALWSGWALLVLVVVATLMMLQVRSEEKRLQADFGQEYLDYQKRTGRFITIKR